MKVATQFESGTLIETIITFALQRIVNFLFKAYATQGGGMPYIVIRHDGIIEFHLLSESGLIARTSIEKAVEMILMEEQIVTHKALVEFAKGSAGSVAERATAMQLAENR